MMMTAAQAAAVRRVLLAIDQALDAFTEGGVSDATGNGTGTLCDPAVPNSHPREMLLDVSTMGDPGWVVCKGCGLRFRLVLPPLVTTLPLEGG